MFSVGLAGNTTKINASSHTVDTLLGRPVFQNYLIVKLAMMKNTLLRQVESYIYINKNFNLYNFNILLKINVVDLTKDKKQSELQFLILNFHAAICMAES